MIHSVYVHAPFCARRCAYCSFSVHVSPSPDFSLWIQALRAELAKVEEEGFFAPGPELKTLFVGGGTPSLLGPQAMEGLLSVLGKDRLGSPELEWTVEGNPESLTMEVARGWARTGVNRVSIGVQSFQSHVLKWLNRIHDPETAVQALERTRSSGIQNLSLDLIFGLPREIERDWRMDLDAAVAQGVPHLSLYGLTVEKGTPLARAVESGKASLPEEEAYREEFLMASELLRAEGYLHYEVSNFCLPGYEARHNRVYWDLEPYLGLGNSAHSYRDSRRRWNLRDWRDYQRACLAGEDPWASQETLALRDTRLERIWLGLRTDRGISISGLSATAISLAEAWVAEGLAATEGEVLRLTPAGWMLLDGLAVDLDLAQGPRVDASSG